jgi:hypothetical protein
MYLINAAIARTSTRTTRSPTNPIPHIMPSVPSYIIKIYSLLDSRRPVATGSGRFQSGEATFFVTIRSLPMTVTPTSDGKSPLTISTLEAQVANSTTKACIILSAAVAISAVIAQHGDAYPAADESFNGHHRVRHGGQHAYWR